MTYKHPHRRRYRKRKRHIQRKRYTDIHVDIKTQKHIDTDRETHTCTERKRHKQRQCYKCIHTDPEAETDRQRQTDKDRQIRRNILPNGFIRIVVETSSRFKRRRHLLLLYRTTVSRDQSEDGAGLEIPQRTNREGGGGWNSLY